MDVLFVCYEIWRHSMSDKVCGFRYYSFVDVFYEGTEVGL